MFLYDVSGEVSINFLYNSEGTQKLLGFYLSLWGLIRGLFSGLIRNLTGFYSEKYFSQTSTTVCLTDNSLCSSFLYLGLSVMLMTRVIWGLCCYCLLFSSSSSTVVV